MTKRQAIMKAFGDELDRRPWIDTASDLRGFIVDVRFAADGLEPRTVVFQPEFERRKESRRP